MCLQELTHLPVKIREEPSIAFMWSSRTGTLQSCWNSVDHILSGKRHWYSQRADDKAKGTWYRGSLAELPLRGLWAQWKDRRCNERNQIKAFISSNITSLMYFKVKLLIIFYVIETDFTNQTEYHLGIINVLMR